MQPEVRNVLTCFLFYLRRMREGTVLGPCGRAVNLPLPLVWGVRINATLCIFTVLCALFHNIFNI
jgi:predicted membrane chloride channel (bestrophin family)